MVQSYVIIVLPKHPLNKWYVMISIYLPTYLPSYLSIYRSIYLSIYLSIYIYVPLYSPFFRTEISMFCHWPNEKEARLGQARGLLWTEEDVQKSLRHHQAAHLEASKKMGIFQVMIGYVMVI